MKLIMMKGLACSGKSTKAKEIVEQGNWVRVNRDLIREMLHFNKFNGKNEGITVDVEKSMTIAFLMTGLNVVVDDCNLNPKNREMWSNVAKDSNAKFEVMEINTPWLECATRELKRQKIGVDVVTKMALQYGLYPQPKKGFVICDIDGTISDTTHRLHYVKDVEKKDWKGFFSEMSKDPMREDTFEKLTSFYNAGFEIIFVTARPEDYRKETEEWLKKHLDCHIDWTALIMRNSGDGRPDTEVKQQIYDMYFKGKYEVNTVIDDRPSVIRMWRENGLHVIDVGEGKEF